MLRVEQEDCENLLLACGESQAEIVADFSPAVWAAQARLYRLAATAANETDQKKIKAVTAQTSSSVAEVAPPM